ncbi:hypothetical protein VE00_10342 [Pseudogymnoascus sp. WSF 3629]|nr:hypothetical protein VE00_10342 [Pseudogymnoascus sp. WSF 3629]
MLHLRSACSSSSSSSSPASTNASASTSTKSSQAPRTKLADPSKHGYFGFLTYFFTSPSVNLDHCDHISNITASSTGFDIEFATSEAYDYALQHWSEDEDLILVTFTEGCADYEGGERCYLKVTGLEFNDSGVVAEGEFCDTSNIISKGETEWGWWIPRSNATTYGSSPGASGPNVTWTGPSSNSTGSKSTASSTSASASASATGTTSDSFADAKSSCVAPVDTVYGLPTACLGDLFDQDLDDELGYLDKLSSAAYDFINYLAPNVEDNATPTDETAVDDFGNAIDLTTVKRRGLTRREKLETRCFLCFIGTAFHAVTHPSETLNALKAIAVDITTVSGSVNKDLSFMLPNPANAESSKLQDPSTKQVQSPWGDSVLIKAFGEASTTGADGVHGYMNVFCVGCGVSGAANVAGRVSWSPAGISAGQIELKANMKFILKIGIDAEMTYQKEFSNTLLKMGLPGLSYGVVQIGPWIEVGTHVTLEADAKGRLLAGAEMGIQAAHVVLDFVNPSNSVKDGFEPYFKPVFEAEGDIKLSATLGLPVGFKFGISIAGWTKSIGLIDEPSIKGTAQAAAAAALTSSNTFAAGFTPVNGCTGISTQLSWRNKLYVDITGRPQMMIYDTNDKLLSQVCISLPALPATVSATTVAPSAATSSTDSAAIGTDSPTTTSESAPGATDSPTSSEDATATPISTDEPLPDAAATSSSSSDAEATTTSAEDPSVPTPDTTSTEDPSVPTPDTTSAEDPSVPTPDTTATIIPRSVRYGLAPRDSSSSTVTDLTSLVASTGAELLYSPSTLPNDPYNDTDGYTYQQLTVPDGSFNFVSCADGSIYGIGSSTPDSNLVGCSEMWATYNDTLVADGSQLLLYYYSNTMNATGVSRLRVADEESMPKRAVTVAMAALANDGNSTDQTYYLAFDEYNNVYYPVLCTYTDGTASKLFLAADPVAGVTMLQSAAVEFSITGGNVGSCFAMPVIMGSWADAGSYYAVDNSTATDADTLTLDTGIVERAKLTYYNEGTM